MRNLLLMLTVLATDLLAVGPGPNVGDTIPSFRLKDQTGKEQTLASITGPKGAIVVFYRSADW